MVVVVLMDVVAVVDVVIDGVDATVVQRVDLVVVTVVPLQHGSGSVPHPFARKSGQQSSNSGFKQSSAHEHHPLAETVVQTLTWASRLPQALSSLHDGLQSLYVTFVHTRHVGVVVVVVSMHDVVVVEVVVVVVVDAVVVVTVVNVVVVVMVTVVAVLVVMVVTVVVAVVVAVVVVVVVVVCVVVVVLVAAVLAPQLKQSQLAPMMGNGLFLSYTAY